MPLFTLIGAGVTLACGIFGFSKLDKMIYKTEKEKFKKDVKFLREQGFTNDQISQIIKRKF